MNKSVFIKDDKFYILERDNHESLEKFYERGWFITHMNPQTKDDYNEAIRLSRIWINIKFDKCIYHNEMMSIINNIIE